MNTTPSALDRWQHWDRTRDSFRGEHWLALGIGLAVLFYGARRRSPLLRSVAATLGTGMIARAAAGRDGLRSALR